MTRRTSFAPLYLIILLATGCVGSQSSDPAEEEQTALVAGCDGQHYPDPATSAYVVPFPAGSTITTGLTNCSSSFHSAETPDRYATDFDYPTGTPFIAARAGVVADLDEDEPSSGGGTGNFVLVDHGDGTHAYYLHSPADGIHVNIGDRVEQGETLGVVGQSGLAGYPHLHFIVVEGDPAWPYSPVPVSFRNVLPRDEALKSHATYTVE